MSKKSKQERVITPPVKYRSGSMNIHITSITYDGVAANNRGESLDSTIPLQTLRRGQSTHTVVSAAARRNALREHIGRTYPVNRSRIDHGGAPAVSFADFPDPNKYADDYLFGYLVTVAGGGTVNTKDGKVKVDEVMPGIPSKRTSLLMTSPAVSVLPFAHDAILGQNPEQRGAYQNTSTAGLTQAEAHYTAYMFHDRISGGDLDTASEDQVAWVRAALVALADHGGVGGNHSRALYDMTPASVAVRITPRLTPQWDSLGWSSPTEFTGLARATECGFGDEVIVGGELAANVPNGMTAYPSVEAALMAALQRALGEPVVG
jgi:CRISPR-associated protein Cst2